MADFFSQRYGELLTGSYDCVDRIVLNAYYPLGHNPGGFRTWWRRRHGNDAQLDNAHLMRMAGGFAPPGRANRRPVGHCASGGVAGAVRPPGPRWVRAAAAAPGIPVIDCKRGERKR